MKNWKTYAAVLAAAFLSAGCAPSAHLDVAHTVFNVGFTEIDKDMLARNMIAVVDFDEAYVGSYNHGTRSLLWSQGIQEGKPEYQLRAVLLNMRYVNSVLWQGAGEAGWPTVGIVPDHFERLRSADIVEVRNVGTRHTSDNFLATGEGNVVLRVLCRKADPGYDKCVAALPHPGGKKWPGGATGSPYLAKASDYGWSFTPAYDASGKPLRVLPEYAAKR